MFKRKQDVDKHVSSILSRKRDEKERNAQGFQIARLYFEIKEYGIAKRYLSAFLSVRENVPPAHQLMGDINVALGHKEAAIENYKRALNLGSFGSSNRHLVLKISELYCELGTDVERMKFWCEQCEKLFPKSDVIYKLKAQIAEATSGQNGDNNREMENLVASELLSRPTDLSLRIKLLDMYMESERYEEAYDTAVSTDLTTAFIDRLTWFECLQSIFMTYSEKFPECLVSEAFVQHYLHVLRNLSYLSMGLKEIDECVYNLQRFDKLLKEAHSLASQDETWLAMLQEMKGQMFFLAGLMLLKRAQTGALTWQEVNHMTGACFLASRSIDPIDAQAPWFVKTAHEHRKFYNWWHMQSYDRISQVGHMLQQLSVNDVIEWSETVRRHTMTAAGHQRIFKALYMPRDTQGKGESSFFYQAKEMVENSEPREPLTVRHMIDVDRVAYQVHLSSLPHLVWLCLQRYTSDMASQPNYHFTILENIQYSVKNMDSGAGESLCQLDLLVFLLATVRCSATALAERMPMYEDGKGRPNLLPVCLSKPLCTPDQEEWWTTAYKFCTNSIKDDFSRMKRILVRGIETVRLIGSHGVSLTMMAHIARSLDAKVKSLREAELGCRCPVYELNALENRAAFYWGKTKQAIERLERNYHSPLPKNRLFKEIGDMDPPPRLMDKYKSEAVFALSVVAMKNGQFEEALEGFANHRSPWAKFHSAKMYKTLAERIVVREGEAEEAASKRQALLIKARDCLYDVMDRLSGDKAHELNMLVTRELDDLQMRIHEFEWVEDRDPGDDTTFHTPAKSPTEARIANSSNGIVHSTPRPPSGTSMLHTTNGAESFREPSQSFREPSLRFQEHNVSSTSDSPNRPRPSPERLDSQIKSLSYNQASLFKMVLDRNEELIVINGKMMEELRDNNNQLKAVLADNKGLMEELKTFLSDNREMMKQIKTELGNLKPSLVPPAAVAPIPPAPPLFMPHIPTPPPRGPFPGFPPQGPVVPPGYNYMINSPVPQAPHRPSGLPGSRASNVGKYRPNFDEEEEEEEDLSSVVEAANLYREFFDPDQSCTQYFTPDSQVLQDWSLNAARSGMETQPQIPLPPLPPRMSMPAPGYFASALRGQSLQYAQASQTPGQVKPGAPTPGFFSTPVTPVVGTAAAMAATGIRQMPVSTVQGVPMVATAPVPASDAAQSPALIAALTGQRSITTGTPKVEMSPVSPAQSLVPPQGGHQILFQAKAVHEPKKSRGDITILVDTNSNRATILMMGENKEILFHHDINGLKLEPSFVASTVIWVGTKVGSTEKERICVTLEPIPLAAQLKDALQKAAALIQPKTPPQQVSSSAPPKIFGGNIVASSTPTTTVSPSVLPNLAASKDAAGKVSHGGLTFSSTPVIAPVGGGERPKAEAHKPVTATTKSETVKPFAGFSLTPTATAGKPEAKFVLPGSTETVKPGTEKAQSPFSGQKPGAIAKSPGATARSPGGGDEEHVEEYEPNVDFKPVISLPELVEKKTGEENETEVFVDRCRLFRFDQETKQWKERGVGEMKILRSKDKVKFRIIMRREQIFKLCANHFLNPDMRLTPMSSSDRAWCYFAMDFSEEEANMEQLAVKFKNAEKAKMFQEVFNDCCRQLKEEQDKKDASAGGKTVAAADSTSGKKPTDPIQVGGLFGCFTRAAGPSLSEMFKPKPGSWECPACLVRNAEDKGACVACGTLNGNKPASAASIPSSSKPSLSEMFKPKAGSWECQGCLVRNNQDVVKCPACGTLKPGAKPEDVPKETTKDKPGTSLLPGMALGPAGTGFTFGAATTSSVMPTTGGFTFNTTAAPSVPAGGFRFGATTASVPASTVAPTGFTFGAAAPTGFVFKTTSATQTTTSTTPASSFTFKPAATTTAPAPAGGFTFNPAQIAKPGFNIGSSSPTTETVPGTGTTPSTGFSFSSGAKPTGFGMATPGKDIDTSQSSAAAGGLLAKLLTSDEATEDVLGTASKPTGGFNFSMAAKSNTAFGGTAPASSGFNFSFTKSPPKTQQATGVVPSSPEVDEHGMYVNKEGDDSHIHFEPVVALPDKIEVKTGEEDEDILFESRGKMYRFVSGEWKEKGLGVVKILQHEVTKKTRVLMRRDQVLKICCNHKIDSSLNLQPMAKSEGKALVWYAMDFSEDEGKMEQLALRFRTADIANEFKKVFDQCRNSAQVTPPKTEVSTSQTQGDSTTVKKELFKADSTTGEDDDVIFIKEEKPTAEQIARARKYQLPDAFYLYESKPPCPGCIGCNDGELPAAVTSQIKPTDKPSVKESPKAKETTNQDLPALGGVANLPDFASLTSDAPFDKTDGGFVFGSGSSIDFSSLAAASGKANEYAWKKADSSSPFKFAGAGQKLFGAGAGDDGDGEGGDDSGVVSSHDVHFEPVIPLPDLVEVKTGEEDWTPLFCHRAKLYKFDRTSSQWKERGIGDIKIMSHNTNPMFRVLQRREQVLKVACNHLISTEMELKPLATSETAWCWVANDFTDTEPSIEKFAVKFKTKETAEEFKSVFENCQEKLKSPCSERCEQGTAVTTQPAQGTRGTLQRSITLDVASKDTIFPSSYTPAGLYKQPVQKDKAQATAEPKLSATVTTPLGDKGNAFHSKALDVAGQDTMTAQKFAPLSGAGSSIEGTMEASMSVPLGDRGNVYHTKALNVSGQDATVPASFTPLGTGESHPGKPPGATSQTGAKPRPGVGDQMAASHYFPQGDKGNVYHRKAIDVAGQDTMVPASFTPLGGKEKVAVDPMTSASVTPLGDKGNVYHTKALDVAGQDTMVPASFTPLGGKEKAAVDPMTSASVTPLGDKGNVYHTKALDVSGQDTMVPASFTPLGGKEKAAVDPMTSSSTTPLGDKGNVYHSKALDVAGQDTMVPASFTPLGGKEKAAVDPMTSASVTLLGDKGNVYHTKALDVAGEDTMVPASFTPLGGKEKAAVDPMTSLSITPLGDKGNVYHTKALDVAGQDTVVPASFTPLQGKDERVTKSYAEALTAASHPQLGDKGNVYHTKALDVAGQDTMVPASYTSLSGKDHCETTSETMTSSHYYQQGDKGNIHHTRALDVAGQDTMVPASYTSLSGKDHRETTSETMTSSHYYQQGDKGNIHHTRALDVAGQDTMVPASYTPLSGKDHRETTSETMTSSHYYQQGDKGNIHHTKALDVAGQDTMVPASFTPLGGKDKEIDDPMMSSSITPLGDKGNVYHTKALDVAGQDTMVLALSTPLGGKEKPTVDPMSLASVTPLGDKGNVYHTKALDVAGQDTMVPASYAPLSGKDQRETTSETMTSSHYYQQGDKGNIHHTKALDVAGQDTMVPASFTPLGGKEKAAVDPMTSSSTSPLGDKGNVYHTKALDVAGQDTMVPASFTPLGGKEKAAVDPMTSSSITPLGDKGNVYYTKALDVAGQDTMVPASFTQLGGKEKPTVDPMTLASVAPLGDKGNVYHTKALDVAGQDTMVPASYAPLSGKDQRETTSETMTSSHYYQQGDKGNIHHTKALDVAGQDTMVPASFTPLSSKDHSTSETMTSSHYYQQGDKGNIHHTKALDVAGQDTMVPASYAPLSGKDQRDTTSETMTSSHYYQQGDKGNIHHTKALDVAGQDTMVPASYTPLSGKDQRDTTSETMTSSHYYQQGDKGNIHHTKALDVAGQDTMVPASYTPLAGKDKNSTKTYAQALSAASHPQLGDKGNVYHTKALDIAGQDTMVPASFAPLGGQSGQQTSQKSHAGAQMSASVYHQQGDKGNIHHTKALDVAGQDTKVPASFTPVGGSGKEVPDTMTSASVIPLGHAEKISETMTASSTHPLGDKGNVYHSKALDVAGADFMSVSSYSPLGDQRTSEGTIMPSSSTSLGDRGNIHHSKALDVAGADAMASASYSQQGDRGNPYHTQSLNQSVPSTHFPGQPSGQTSTISHPVAGARARADANFTMAQAAAPTDSHMQQQQMSQQQPQYGQQQQVAQQQQQQVAQQQQQQHQAGAAYEEDDGGDDSYEDDDEEDEKVLFEKRATLNSFEDGKWKKLGTGDLQVTYNEDLNGNSIHFIGDKGNRNQRTCEWRPIDYATDEPIRKHFSVTFSSVAAAEEFVKMFHEGQKLAIDSELSETLPSEIDVPEIYSGGEPGY